MDPTLFYCKLDLEKAFRSFARRPEAPAGSPDIHREWGARFPQRAQGVWSTPLAGESPQLETDNDYTGAASIIDSTTVERDENAWRATWTDGLADSIRRFFGDAVDEFYDASALVFANIDALVNFTGRQGGYVARSEARPFSSCFAGSLALPGVGYSLFRVPAGDVLYLTERKVAPFWLPAGSHYVIENYSAKFADAADSPGPFVVPSVIAERFPAQTDLVAGDFDLPLEDIHRVLRPDGHLVLFLPANLRLTTAEVLSSYRDVIHDVSMRFDRMVVFSPMALLGRGLVLVASQVHARLAAVDDTKLRIEEDVERYLERAAEQIEAQFRLDWADMDRYDHERACVAWNVF